MYLLAHSKCANPHSGEVMNISYIMTLLNDPRTHITLMNSANFGTLKEIMILKLVPRSFLFQFNTLLIDIFKNNCQNTQVRLKICEQADRNPNKNSFTGCIGN